MNQELAALDRALARKGEIIILRRNFGTTPSTTVDVELRAFVRGYAPQELVGGISQTDSLIVTSPTEITRAQWPGGQTPTSGLFVSDPRLPKKNDRVIVQGRLRNVETVGPIFIGDELVRIEMRVLG